MKKIIIGLVIIAIAFLGYYFFKSDTAAENLGAVIPTGMPIDVIGTRVGTTTTGVGFYGLFAATTSVISRIDSYTDTVTFTIDAVSASSSGAAHFSILGSNDLQCDTASTSAGTMNTVVTTDIRWFDLGTNLLNLAGTATLTTGTSTYAWTGITSGDRKQIVLTDVNTSCLKFEANASSTILQVQMLTRSKLGF